MLTLQLRGLSWQKGRTLQVVLNAKIVTIDYDELYWELEVDYPYLDEPVVIALGYHEPQYVPTTLGEGGELACEVMKRDAESGVTIYNHSNCYGHRYTILYDDEPVLGDMIEHIFDCLEDARRSLTQ